MSVPFLRLVVGGEGGRAAGIPTLEPLGRAPTELPDVADFSGEPSREEAPFWMIGRDLFQGRAVQVLRDVRQELGVPDSAFVWSLGVLERAQTKARERDASTLLPSLPSPADGASVPVGWLQVCLWLAYSSAPTRLSQVRLPRNVILPTFGGEAWVEPTGAVTVYRNFDPALLTHNPFFRPLTGEETHLVGYDDTTDPPPPRSESAGGNGGLLVGLGLAVAFLLGGRS